ncbi:uncharacterized protein LOC119462672 isoform X1 [Dermacentor silvarum]|uniref:uncharacterized protein LOC119462672 isoform X1 n=1 Tax=Dermacentor silvarum TaxID=543639 RepID=UPI001899E5B5|nr:uncharacterized protein LOC119462672 isoform X1 [Dermacentor silvarum]
MREGSWSEANRKMPGTVVRYEKVKQEPVPLDTEIRHPAGIALNSSGEPKARWHYSQAFSQVSTTVNTAIVNISVSNGNFIFSVNPLSCNTRLCTPLHSHSACDNSPVDKCCTRHPSPKREYTRHSSRQEYARDLKYMNSSSHAYRRSEYSLSDCRSSHRSHRKHRRHH